MCKTIRTCSPFLHRLRCQSEYDEHVCEGLDHVVLDQRLDFMLEVDRVSLEHMGKSVEEFADGIVALLDVLRGLMRIDSSMCLHVPIREWPDNVKKTYLDQPGNRGEDGFREGDSLRKRER